MTTNQDAGEVRVYVRRRRDARARRSLARRARRERGVRQRACRSRRRDRLRRGINLYAPIPYSERRQGDLPRPTRSGGVLQRQLPPVRSGDGRPELLGRRSDDLCPATRRDQRGTGHAGRHRPRRQPARAETAAGGREDMVYDLSGTGAIRQLKRPRSPTRSGCRAERHVCRADLRRPAHGPRARRRSSSATATAAHGALQRLDDLYRTVSASGTMTSRWVMPYRAGGAGPTGQRGSPERQARRSRSTRATGPGTPARCTSTPTFREETGVKTRGGNGTTDFRYLTVRGRGVYVGDTLSLNNGSSSWWGEGDEKVYVDYVDADGVGHNARPDHIGTGSEDYYGYAWGHRDLFDTAFIAQPISTGQQHGRRADRQLAACAHSTQCRSTNRSSSTSRCGTGPRPRSTTA